jgi:hypothetical protein
MMGQTDHATHMREIINVLKILVRDPERKEPLVRLTCVWKNNIKIDFKIFVRVWTGFLWLMIRWSGTVTELQFT